MTKPVINAESYSIRQYTSASLRLASQISYEGKTADEVFNIMGDPERIVDWYLLAKQVKLQGSDGDDAQNFNVEFTFFGDVFEEILYWDPPHRYVYAARGEDFPMRDYVACIELEEHSPSSGVMSWKIYSDIIEGENFQRILPVILPVINEVSMQKLSSLIGGTKCRVESYF